jgi:hypothetical protein
MWIFIRIRFFAYNADPDRTFHSDADWVPYPASYTANEGLVKILHKCLVPIYVFPEMNLLFPKQNYNVLSPSSYTHIFIYFQDRSAYSAAGNVWTNPGNI